jgi:hypothetical protein
MVSMKVRLELGLDFEGQHTLGWQPSDAAGALDIPRATLERWVAEHEAFKVASLRWRRVIEEVEEQLYRAERELTGPRLTRPISGEAAKDGAHDTSVALVPQVAGEARQEPAKARKSTALAAQLATISAAPRRRPRG